LLVQIVWGWDDPAFPLKDAENTISFIRDVRLDVIDNCGHMSRLE